MGIKGHRIRLPVHTGIHSGSISPLGNRPIFYGLQTVRSESCSTIPVATRIRLNKILGAEAKQLRFEFDRRPASIGTREEMMAWPQYWTAVTFILLQVVCFGHGDEAQDGNAMGVFGGTTVTTEIQALEYLTAFSWIPTDGSASELINLEEPIRNFQEYAGLEVTGKLDQATLDLMSAPRCGNVDFGPEGYRASVTRRKRFTTLGSAWPQNDLTWYLEGVSPDLSRTVIRTELAAAFQYWEDESALTFREVNTNDADILVNFYTLDHGDGNPFDGRGNVLAHAFGPGRGRGGDMHFDDDETFTAARGVNLQQVAVHEIGHSLGLGHSSDNNAIMAPFYKYRENLVLGIDDVNGIRSLYGPPTNNPVTRPPIPTDAPMQTTMTTVTPARTLPPIFCNGEFDAATESFDNAVYLFQGDDVFKVRNFRIEAGYPRSISAEFPGAGIPSFVDAALLWTIDERNKYMYLFKGNLYWRVYNGQASPGYPRPISAWGLPGNIDGAFRWPGNKRIYFFKGDQYYRYNTMSYRIDGGYPRPQSAWTGVISPLAAVLDFGGQSYFFNGQYFQIFNTQSFRASANFQAAQTWLGCQTEGLRDYNETLATTEAMTTSGVELGAVPPNICVVILASLLGAIIQLTS